MSSKELTYQEALEQGARALLEFFAEHVGPYIDSLRAQARAERLGVNKTPVYSAQRRARRARAQTALRWFVERRAPVVSEVLSLTAWSANAPPRVAGA